MIILGLDVSSSCTGWAIVEGANLIAYGEIALDKFKKKKHPLEWMEILYNEITSICSTHKVEVVFIEDTFNQRNVKTLKVLARARGVAEIACLHSGIKSITLGTPSELRKAALGKGNLKSEEICSILEDRYSKPIRTKGFDQCDAIVIALAGAKLS